MILGLVFVPVALLCASGLAAVVVGRSDRAALWIGTIGSAVSCALSVAAALAALLGGERSSLRLTWSLPVGELHVGLDALSSFFLVCLFLVSGLAAVYGGGYLRPYIGKRRLAPTLFFFNLLVASMAVVIVARDGILFLIAWDVMSLTSFFLVTFESEREEVRRAGMTYLIASQLGVVFLFVLFALLSRHTAGTYDFEVLGNGGAAGFANVYFLLALVGFGTKAGFWPLHVWLPDAHPAAPSHVSALMSGVMIKIGIYGLLRTLTFLGRPEAWWGATLIVVGTLSGLIGILHALAQKDLKRRLAYSSVENIGIIGLGIGIGLLGKSQASQVAAFLGFAGALLHVLNHGLFKGLLSKLAGRPSRRRHSRYRQPGRPFSPHAGNGRDVSRRFRSHLRLAAAQRIRRRVAAVHRGVPGRVHPSDRLGRLGARRDSSARAHRRTGRDVLRERFRRCFPGPGSYGSVLEGPRSRRSYAGTDGGGGASLRRDWPLARRRRAISGAGGHASGRDARPDSGNGPASRHHAGRRRSRLSSCCWEASAWLFFAVGKSREPRRGGAVTRRPALGCSTPRPPSRSRSFRCSRPWSLRASTSRAPTGTFLPGPAMKSIRGTWPASGPSYPRRDWWFGSCLGFTRSSKADSRSTSSTSP